MVGNSTPILVGCGDVTDEATSPDAARSPLDLIAEAGRLALADTCVSTMAQSIDTVAMIRLFSESSPRFATKLGNSTNPPKSIANRLGIDARRHLYTSSGGNMPQFVVNSLAEAIARGEIRSALIAGGEALRTQHALERAGQTDLWNEDPGGEPELVGQTAQSLERSGGKTSAASRDRHVPAIGKRDSRSLWTDRSRIICGRWARLFARLSEVAAANPLATRRESYSAERLSTIDNQNRWIGFPYPRLMVSNAYVDQAAALIMTSVGEAVRLGIPPAKWVYLRGCADGHDHWHVSERVELHSSPAIRWGAKQALDMAGQTLADMRFFDLYSCFPAAVDIACREIGLDAEDPRGLTVTGGLPFFGGPGNNYVTHSIAEMMRRCAIPAG